MASQALETWAAERSSRLDELFAAHARVGGRGAGRRTETEQINWALVLRLAAEFQGFARDLHADGVDHFSVAAAGGSAQLEEVVSTLLTFGLKLDVGNATGAALGDAYNRFGLPWWRALEQRDRRTRSRHAQLERLNRARNAIAHSRLTELATLRSEGFPLTLATVRDWRSALDGLARTMDAVLAAHLGAFFGQGLPW